MPCAAAQGVLLTPWLFSAGETATQLDEEAMPRSVGKRACCCLVVGECDFFRFTNTDTGTLRCAAGCKAPVCETELFYRFDNLLACSPEPLHPYCFNIMQPPKSTEKDANCIPLALKVCRTETGTLQIWVGQVEGETKGLIALSFRSLRSSNGCMWSTCRLFQHGEGEQRSRATSQDPDRREKLPLVDDGPSDPGVASG